MMKRKSILWKMTYYINRSKWTKDDSALLADSEGIQAGTIGIIFIIIFFVFSLLNGPTTLSAIIFIIGAVLIFISAICTPRVERKIRKEKLDAINIREKKEKDNRQKEIIINELLLEKIKIEENRNKLAKIAMLRDADHQQSPYTYEIGRHGNETLAIRYGIANIDNKNSIDSRVIKVQKIRKAGMLLNNIDNETIEVNCYLVKLVEFRNREALAIIEPGTEYIKTFYPRYKSWFSKNKHLEEVLKGNSTMLLKEIATFHILKAVTEP